MTLNLEDLVNLGPLLTGNSWDRFEAFIARKLLETRELREGPVRETEQPDLYVRGQVEILKQILGLRRNYQNCIRHREKLKETKSEKDMDLPTNYRI